jgi:hypothetical protein
MSISAIYPTPGLTPRDDGPGDAHGAPGLSRTVAMRTRRNAHTPQCGRGETLI